MFILCPWAVFVIFLKPNKLAHWEGGPIYGREACGNLVDHLFWNAILVQKTRVE
jgi:hypothetical protein